MVRVKLYPGTTSSFIIMLIRITLPCTRVCIYIYIYIYRLTTSIEPGITFLPSQNIGSVIIGYSCVYTSIVSSLFLKCF